MKIHITQSIIVLTLIMLVFSSTNTLAQTNSILPAQFVPGDTAIGAAAGLQLAPAISQGGDTLLAVWTDGRSKPPNQGDWYETANDIYAMRMDASGTPLDPVAFPVTQAPGAQENPQAAWNGTQWLVVFESTGLGGTGYYYEKSLAAVRVAPDGTVLDTSQIPIFNSLPTTGAWSVASDGTDWVIAFQGSAASNDLQAIRITASGELVQPATSLVVQTYYMRFNLRLSYAAGVFLLSWSDYSEAMAIRFDQNFNVLDPEPFTLTPTPGAVLNSQASNGSQFYIVWHQQQPDYTIAVTGTRIDPDGTKLDGDGDNISGANDPQAYTTTSVAWDGTYWWVNWDHNNAVRMARVSTDGQVLDPGGVAIAGPSSGVTAGTVLGGVQMAWSTYTNWQNDVISANISADNTPGPNIPLSTGGPMQIRSDAAAGSGGYMVVYRSDTGDQGRILAQPLDVTGTPLTAEPVQLDVGSTENTPGRPAVAWNDSLYLAVWHRSGSIFAQRIQQDGSLVDPSPISVMTGFDPVDVAAVGDVFLVAGLRFGLYPEVVYPIGARLRGSDGVVLDGTPITIGENYTRSMAVTTFGDRWLAVSFATYSHDDSVGSTVGSFIESDGTAGSVFGIYGPYSMGGNGIIEVAAASNGTNALVLQSAEVTSGVETDMTGRLVNADGTLQPIVNYTPWSGNQYRPRLTWDGSQYIAVFNEQKNRFAPWTMDAIDATSDLFGMRISSSGAPVDPGGFAFSLSKTAEAYPNVTAANGVALLTGSVLLNQSPYAAYRVGYSLFGQGGNQWPVAVATGSTSGGDTPLEVNFSSSGSTDPDGSLASYSWDFGDGVTSDQLNPSHTFTVPGNYVVTLTVTDNGGVQTTNTVASAVTAPNQIPIAIAAADPPSGPPPLDVVFSAAGSYDPDGSLGNFYWQFSDGGDYYGPTAYHTFSDLGIHQVTLTVYDNRGDAGSTTVSVYVGMPNQVPVAVVSAVPTSGVAPLEVDLSSTGSHDPDGSIVSYNWDFGDGSTSTLPNPAHTYTQPGSYQATLTVTDDDGASDSANVSVEVLAPQFGLALSPDLSASGKPGETITYTLLLTNTGNSIDTFTISTTVSGTQWTTTAPASVGPLGAGESTSLAVGVAIPAQVTNGEQSTATILATSQGDSAVSKAAQLTTTAEVTYGVSLSPGTLAGSGQPGSTVTYTLTVTNTSDVAVSFDISSASNWQVDLSSTQLDLVAGASAPVIVEVHIPEVATNGEQDVAIIQASSSGQTNVEAQAELTTTAAVPLGTPLRLYIPLAIKGLG